MGSCIGRGTNKLVCIVHLPFLRSLALSEWSSVLLDALDHLAFAVSMW